MIDCLNDWFIDLLNALLIDELIDRLLLLVQFAAVGLTLHAHCSGLKECAKEREKLMKAATKERETALKVVQEKDDALKRKTAEKEEAVQSQRLVEDGRHGDGENIETLFKRL